MIRIKEGNSLLTYENIKAYLLERKNEIEKDLTFTEVSEEEKFRLKGKLDLVKMELDDLECVPDFIWEEVSEKQQSVEETTRKNQYLICFREDFNGERQIGRYMCEATSMKEAVQLLKSISNSTLEILSVSYLDGSIKDWKDLE